MILLFFFGADFAHSSPVGRWQTVDDKTGEVKSVVIIEEIRGVLFGKITQLLNKKVSPNALCEKCSDDRKDQPILGLEIIRGVKKVDAEDLWEGGEILDPNEGKTYRVTLKPIENEKKLEVRGHWGPFSRRQVWIRVE
jgi:uncharacterized protein (DUF2147 family)